MMREPSLPTGHRQRLRDRLLQEAGSLSEHEQVELLLAYAIPRQDVSPLAATLLRRFGGVAGLLAASAEDLLAVTGVGPYSAGLIRLAGLLHRTAGGDPVEERSEQLALPLAELQPDPRPEAPLLAPLADEEMEQPDAAVRTYTNDLIATALVYLPQALVYTDLAAYQAYLLASLPYNSQNSRRRYASNLLARYFPAGTLQTPLMQLLAHAPDAAAFKAALLYETARAEPAVRLVSEQVIWPALATGFLTRAQFKERVVALFPEAGPATIQRMVLSLINTYTQLDLIQAREGVLRLQQRAGAPDAFAYVLAAEFPEPGMYSFEQLETGPARLWLLWDRAWMRGQLYGLAHLDILDKVSEIDAFRQFSLSCSRQEMMRRYFAHPQRRELALRESEPML